jgi:predicted peptidase
MIIREKGPLAFIIIVAPLLSKSPDYEVFPDNYLTGVLEEVLADYRVDQTRIYVTGLSLGGEATYRFALLRPATFAAIAPLSAFVYSSPPLERIKDLPVWAIHGADDKIIPLSMAQKPVDVLKQAEGNVQFTILPDHDHDTWTDTYSDPKFYEWLLQHQWP